MRHWLLLTEQASWLLLGLFLITSSLQAQPDTTARLEDQLALVEDNYFYRNLDSAFYWYQKIAEQAENQRQWLTLLETKIQIAWCALHHQRLDTLPSLLQQASSISLTHQSALDTLDPNHVLRLNLPYTWGLYYNYTEDYTEAINAYQEITSLKEAFSDSSLVSDTYYSTAVAYRKLENYQQAILHHQLALSWLPKDFYGSRYWYHKGIISKALGTSYSDYGTYKKDKVLQKKAKKLIFNALTLLNRYRDEDRARYAIHATYQSLAHWFEKNEQYDSALYFLQQATPFYRSQDPELFETYALWGNLYVNKKQPREARIYYQKALTVLDEIYGSQHPKKAVAYNLIANSYAGQQRWTEALPYLQRAFAQFDSDFNGETHLSNPAIAQLLPPNQSVLQTLLIKANTLYRIHKNTASDTTNLLLALETYNLSIRVLEEMRQTFPSLEYKQFISAKAASLYEQAIRASLRAYELGLTQKDFLAEAFYFSEKGKAATLLEAVKTSEARSFADIPADLLEQENGLKRELTYWENQLYQAEDDSTQPVLRNRAFETREAYNALVKRLEEEYPNYYQLKYDTDVVGLAQLQAQLSENAALLSFSYGDSTLYAFTVRSDTMHYHAVPLDSLFRRRLENVLQTVSRYDFARADNPAMFRKFAEDAHQLYRTLVQPSFKASADPIERLAIIPDGLLGYLPFDVLLTEAPTTTKVDYRSLPYLVKLLPVSYEYSATLLTNATDPKQEVSYPYLGFAPSYQDAPLAESREVRTTLDGQLPGLGQLRYNREEVRVASDLFGGKTFTGNEATETQFKQQASQGKLLHLSMHAYAHDENDDFSGLIFTQQPDSTQEDGFLHSNELYNLSLHAELAVLSACETGIGTLAPGEGIMSLGRAFKYAGCPNVTMSLWNADDQSTNRIMQRFFAQLHGGSAKDEALREAKLDYLAQAKSAQAHPYYWAAFVQVGDHGPLSSAAGFSGWWWMGGGVVVVLMLGGGIFFIRNR